MIRRFHPLNDDHDDVQRTLALALDLLEQCPRAYRSAPDHIKKLFNQVFFEKVLVFRDESPKIQMAEPFATLVGPQLRFSVEKGSIDEDATPEIQNSPAQMSGTGEMAGLGAHFERQPRNSAGAIFGNNTLVRDPQKVVHQSNLDNYTLLRSEVQRWRDILAVPYANYKSMLVPR